MKRIFNICALLIIIFVLSGCIFEYAPNKKDVILDPGESQLFSIKSTGPITWYLDGIELPGETTPFFVFPGNSVGLYHLKVETQLGGRTDSRQWTVIVNNRPVLNGTSESFVVTGNPYSFRPVAEDADDDLLVFSIQGKPAWADFNDTTGELYGTPGFLDIGTYTDVVIMVFDAYHRVEMPPIDIIVLSANTADLDDDDVLDIVDNCPGIANFDQLDEDVDGVGDICDNCPTTWNSNQVDTDIDGIGDECDNCPGIANPGQEDIDNDGSGNPCDDDIDGDGITNIEGEPICPDRVTINCSDNCPINNNPGQWDNDKDGLGNACDNCPDVQNPNQIDTDGDGIGDACDTS